MNKKTTADAKALSPIDALLAVAPDAAEFSIPLGDKIGSLRFRRIADYTEMGKFRKASLEKAREIYPAFIGGAIDEDRLQTLATCIQMADLSLDELPFEKLYAVSKKFGGAFHGIVEVFNVRMTLGEQELFTKAVSDAKKD